MRTSQQIQESYQKAKRALAEGKMSKAKYKLICYYLKADEGLNYGELTHEQYNRIQNNLNEKATSLAKYEEQQHRRQICQEQQERIDKEKQQEQIQREKAKELERRGYTDQLDETIDKLNDADLKAKNNLATGKITKEQYNQIQEKLTTIHAKIAKHLLNNANN